MAKRVPRVRGTGFGRPRSGPAVLVLVLMALSLAGCHPSDGSSTASAPPRTQGGAQPSPLATTTTSARQAAEAAVLRDYAAFWDAYVEAARTANAEDPALGRWATGEALRGIQLQLTLAKRSGVVATGRPERSGTRITRLRDSTASIAECLDSSRWLRQDARTGKVRGNPDGNAMRRVRAALTRAGDRWKVSELDIEVAACAGNA